MKYFFLSPFALYTSLALLLYAAGCGKKKPDATGASFQQSPVGYPLTRFINEASGIADSKINPGYIWVEEDSNNPPQLYLLSHTGVIAKTVYIKGATNRDWEDIALANGPDASKKYLYIGDIGDNDAVHASSVLYRFEEPRAEADTVGSFNSIVFAYADGPRDAEAFLVDDHSLDIYIITKRDLQSRLYKISYPYSTTSLNTAVFVETLPYNGVVSAAISNDGRGVIVKTYPALFYYDKTPEETIAKALQKEGRALGYLLEPLGEAVGFAQDNSGFYTLSERENASGQTLYLYKKN